MPPSPVELWWAFIVGTLVLLALGVGFIASLIVSHRRFVDAQQKQIEALRESEERFQLVARATNDMIYDWNLTTNRIWFNEALERMFGYPQATSNHDREWWLDQVHPEDRAQIEKSFGAVFAKKRSDWQEEYRFRRANGSYAWVLDRAHLLYDGAVKPIRWIGSVMDITERKRAEEALRHLSKRILEAQESERRRVSRELHDGVNQLLATAKFRVESLDEQIPRRSARLKQEARKTKMLLDKVMMEVRRISRNLRPSELDDLGLISAVRSLADEFGERTGIEVDLHLPELEDALTPEIELTLYRIIQEALTNIEKHARATRVSVTLDKTSSLVTARIADNGKGLNQKKPARARGKDGGMGLLDMRERLMLLHGTLEIIPGRPRGTVIEVSIPLSNMSTSSEA